MNSKTIARNSLWYGLETGIGLISGIVTSIIIGRVLGPVKMGHYTYIAWLVSISSSVGALGIPAATYKYMAEYLGRGDAPIAKAIFLSTLRLQIRIASLLTLIAVGIAWFGADPSMKWTAVALAAAMWPAMVVAIPSQANMANENLAANVPGALVSNLIYICGVAAAVTFSQDTLGLALTVLTMRTAELLVRIIPVLKRMKAITSASIPPEIRRRLFMFSRQSTMLLLFSIIVWDRSEVIVLRYCSDIRQLAFYTVVFNVTERLRVLPQAFSSATGASMMAQFGRDPKALAALLSTSIRYLLLFAVPIHIGLALLCRPVIALTYGARYIEAVPLLAIASLLALPKIILMPVNSLLAAADRQAISVRLNIWMAILNVGLDFALIPKWGAMGAVIANGVSQTIAAVCLCWFAGSALKLQWPLRDLGKMAIVATMMAASLLALPSSSSQFLDLLLGIAVGITVYGLGVRLTKVLADRDGRRLLQVSSRFPSSLQVPFARCLQFLIPNFGSVGL